MKRLYTVSEAATLLSKHSDTCLSDDDVIDFARQQQLPVCFDFDGDISGIAVRNPTGQSNAIELVVPLRGIVRSMTPPQDRRSLTATIVEVVRVDGMKYEHRDGVLAKGQRLPTMEPHGGYIHQGFKVTGFVDYVDIPIFDWLFFIDDLLRLTTGTSNNVDIGTSTTVWHRLARTEGERWFAEKTKARKRGDSATTQKDIAEHLYQWLWEKGHRGRSRQRIGKTSILDQITGMAKRKKIGMEWE